VALVAFAGSMAVAGPAALAAGGGDPVAWGTQRAAEPDAGARRITVTAAKAPRRAFELRLTFPASEEWAGNGAAEYLRALATFNQPQVEAGNRMADLLGVPIENFPVQEATDLIAKTGFDFEMVERAARADRCDWNLPLREEGIGLVLPEVGRMRQFARLIALRARIEAAKGDFPAAVRSLRVGYALGIDLGCGPTLIHGLVGIAIGDLMLRQTGDVLERPGAPSLYWALTELPSPFIDLRHNARSEQSFIDFTLPEIGRIERGEVSPAEAGAAFVAAIKRVQDSMGLASPQEAQLLATASAVVDFPAAREAMIRDGVPAEKVDALPVSYVSLMHNIALYRRASDEASKWFSVPFWQGAEGLRRATEALDKPVGGLATPFAQLLPAFSKAQVSIASVDRRMATLRAVEAVRLYAGANGGALPPSLEAIPDVPVPIDPFTGKPLAYAVEAGEAVFPTVAQRHPDWQRVNAPEVRVRIAK
jgi:hypothetical protein